MRNYILFLTTLTIFLNSCGQSNTGHAANADNDKLTCLVLGYDSIIYYTGSSANMQQIKKGKLTDSIFVTGMFKKVKEQNLLMILKPGDGGDMMPNFTEMISLTNSQVIIKRAVDSINTDEEKAFGVTTPPQIKGMMRGQSFQPLKLGLPKDASDNSGVAYKKLSESSQLSILLSSDQNVYAYMGGDIQKGKKYTYEELKDTIRARKSNKNFSAVIKPGKSSSYKSVVDILDLMQIVGLKNYAVIDITKEDEDYLNQVAR